MNLIRNIIRNLRIAIFPAAVLLFNCGINPFADRTVEKIGMLLVIDPEDCGIPEGCGPKYTLWDEEFKIFIPLIYNVDDNLHQLIIKVEGEKTVLPICEYNSMSFDGPMAAILVETCEPISTIKYHKYLLEKAEEYYIEKYGEHKSWNKTFFWGMIDDEPVLKARMDKAWSDTEPQYVELWYNGVTGILIKEINTIIG
ncbi:hypothetical protein ACFLT7_08035 [candidate division KSB1 bacterium]